MLSKLARAAIDLAFPINCYGCGREGAVICPVCVDGLERLAQPYCRICAEPGTSGVCRWCLQHPRGFDSLRSPYRFQGAVREAIHAFKYRGVRAAAETLSRLMADYLARNAVAANAVVPVPLHRSRLRSRGYNQSALLARGVAENRGIPLWEDLLARTGNPRPQVEAQTGDERRANVVGSFACTGEANGLVVLLVDDVATTASTLSECAVALKDAGASRVYALTLARDG